MAEQVPRHERLRRATGDRQRDRFGNAGRNILRGPNQTNFDIALSRIITTGGLRDDAKVELRLEAFNVFNTPQFGLPDQCRGAGRVRDHLQHGRSATDPAAGSEVSLLKTQRVRSAGREEQSDDGAVQQAAVDESVRARWGGEHHRGRVELAGERRPDAGSRTTQELQESIEPMPVLDVHSHGFPALAPVTPEIFLETLALSAWMLDVFPARGRRPAVRLCQVAACRCGAARAAR